MTEVVSGKRAVQLLLIDPLERDGMVRSKKTSAEDHSKFLDKIRDRLGYLNRENLERLRIAVMGMGQGPNRNVWPGWVSIRATAFALQTPPDPSNPIFQSWLTSVEGPGIREAGQAAEFYLFLRKHQRPPNNYARAEIANQARDNHRERQRILELIENGNVRDEQRQWLTWYDKVERTALDFIEHGDLRRARAKAAEQGEEV